MVEYPKIGYKVKAKVIEMKGECTIKMKVGDEYELSIHKCGDFCGYFYHNIFNWIVMLQFGAKVPPILGPDEDTIIWECPNPKNRVKIELKRIKE